MNVVIMGPPGSGKGTQGERIAARYDLQHISTGDLLRAEVAEGTSLGRQVSDLMERGDLVPDQLITDLVMPRVIAAAHDRGYVLDGYPRSVEQAREGRARAEAAGAEPQVVVYLEVERDELMRRILARAEIEGRADDNAETVANRLQVFEESTEPLIDYYRGRELLLPIRSAGSVDEVAAIIASELDRYA